MKVPRNVCFSNGFEYLQRNNFVRAHHNKEANHDGHNPKGCMESTYIIDKVLSIKWDTTILEKLYRVGNEAAL